MSFVSTFTGSSSRSSANIYGSLNFNTSGRSFMKIQKNNGPINDPCGTPLVISKVSDEKLSAQTNCGQHEQAIDKNAENHAIAFYTDFSMAFDKISHYELLKKMNNIGVGGCFLEIIPRNLLSARSLWYATCNF